jgi:hypothetical protein
VRESCGAFSDDISNEGIKNELLVKGHPKGIARTFFNGGKKLSGKKCHGIFLRADS